MKPAIARSLFRSILLSACLISAHSAHSQQRATKPPVVQFSASAPLRKLEAPPPDTTMQLTFGRWDDQIVAHHYDHLENLYDPDRTHDDFARDMLRSGGRAVTQWAKDTEFVRETREQIEEKVNDAFSYLSTSVKNWFRLDLAPPREQEPYGSSFRERLFDYKVKLNISTHPSLEVRALHSARLRLYHDQVRAAYEIKLPHAIYAKIGVMFPFDDEKIIEPYLRIQHEWQNGEVGIGVRARRQDKEDKDEIYGGVFLAMGF